MLTVMPGLLYLNLMRLAHSTVPPSGAFAGDTKNPPPSAKYAPSSASRKGLVVPASAARRGGSTKLSSRRGLLGSAARDPPAYADDEDADDYGLDSEEDNATASSDGETAVTGSEDDGSDSDNGNADETLGDASTVGGNTTVSDLSAILPDDDDDESVTPKKGKKQAASSAAVGANVRAAADEALARARALAQRATAGRVASSSAEVGTDSAALAARRGSLGTFRRARRATISQGTSPGVAVVRSVSASVTAAVVKPAMVSTGAGASITPPKRSAASASTGSSASSDKRSARKAARSTSAAIAAAAAPAPAAASSAGASSGGAAFDHDDGFDAGDFDAGYDMDADVAPPSSPEAPPSATRKSALKSPAKASTAASSKAGDGLFAGSSDEDAVPASASKGARGKGGASKGSKGASKSSTSKSKSKASKGAAKSSGKKTGRAASSRTIGGPSQRRSLSFAPDTKADDSDGHVPLYDSSSEDEGKWLSPGGRDRRRVRKSLGRERRETVQAEEESGVRRSGRRRWAPLEYWSGEHLTYTRADEEDPVAEVMPVVVDAYKEGALETEEERRERREEKRIAKEGGVKRTRSTKRSTRTSKKARKGDGEGGTVRVETKTVTRTVAKKVPTDPKDLPPLPASALPDGVEVAEDSRFTVAGVDGQPSQVFPVYRRAAELRLQALPVMERPDGTTAAARAGAMFDTPHFVNGLITLDPLAYKEPENTGNCTQVFFVVSCQPQGVEIQIADKTFLASPGDHFWVPTNTVITVKNHSPEIKAELSFVLLKPQ